MDEKKVLSIVKEDGTIEEVELIISFVFNDKESLLPFRGEGFRNTYYNRIICTLPTRP